LSPSGRAAFRNFALRCGRFEAMDILQQLEDLHKQATTERSHYYVASCCKAAIAEIVLLRTKVKLLQQRREA
jgi:hypothetical protein